MEYSAISLIPPIVAIALTITTRKVLPSLFIGIWLGATIINSWNPILGFLALFKSYIIPCLGSEWNATVILYGGAFGGLLSLLQKTGGAFALREFFVKKIRHSMRLAQCYTMLMGMIIFFDDYFSCLTVGLTMRPITDKLKIAREKLAFIVDSTSAPICLLVPLSTWVMYVVGIIGKEVEDSSLIVSPYIVYLKTIPINIYALMALTCTAFFCISKRSFGPMRKAEERVRITGKLMRDGAKPPVSEDLNTISDTDASHPELKNLLIPITILMLLFPILFLYTGGYWEKDGGDLFRAIAKANGAYSVLISVVIAGFSGLLLGIIKKLFTFETGLNHYIDGAKGMIRTYLILILAWSTAAMIKDLGTSYYITSTIMTTFSPSLIPAILFLVSAIISFTTGTSYGTFAIIIPMAIPFATTMSIPLEYIIAPILSGGIFGDHCSPLSDTTILASTGTACDPVDHVITQLPYALLSAISSILGFIALGYYKAPAIALLTALVSFLCTTLIITKKSWRFKSR